MFPELERMLAAFNQAQRWNPRLTWRAPRRQNRRRVYFLLGWEAVGTSTRPAIRERCASSGIRTRAGEPAGRKSRCRGHDFVLADPGPRGRLRAKRGLARKTTLGSAAAATTSGRCTSSATSGDGRLAPDRLERQGLRRRQDQRADAGGWDGSRRSGCATAPSSGRCSRRSTSRCELWT